MLRAKAMAVEAGIGGQLYPGREVSLIYTARIHNHTARPERLSWWIAAPVILVLCLFLWSVIAGLFIFLFL